MIDLAKMVPGVSSKSGRRYFRGRDKSGTTWWMIEEPGSDGQRWKLAFDFPRNALGDLPEPTAALDPSRMLPCLPPR